MLTIPFVVVALVMANVSPSGSVSLPSGKMVCVTPFVPDTESLFATGGRLVTLMKMIALAVPPLPSLMA